MTYADLLEEIEQLSREERQALLTHLMLSLQEEEGGARAGSLLPLRGCLRPEGSLPKDEELRDDYTEYLTGKYS
jgi:hypothetical protein